MPLLKASNLLRQGLHPSVPVALRRAHLFAHFGAFFPFKGSWISFSVLACIHADLLVTVLRTVLRTND